MQWAIQQELKPYKRRYPEFIATTGDMIAKAKGAFWVRYTLVDRNSVSRQHYRPFLTIDKDFDESPLLIGVPRLKFIGISIHLDQQKTIWEYRLKPQIKIDSKKRFIARLKKHPKVYSVVLKELLFPGPLEEKEANNDKRTDKVLLEDKERSPKPQ
jgi:hypothetical protein